MKKVGLMILLALLAMAHVWAYDSGIAVQTEKGTTIQVFVNGKLYNKQPGKFVRVRSSAGLFHLEVKAFNPHDRKWYTLKKDIQVEKGFEGQYKVVFVNKRPELREMRKYPLYTRYFLNPSLYNKHPVT